MGYDYINGRGKSIKRPRLSEEERGSAGSFHWRDDQDPAQDEEDEGHERESHPQDSAEPPRLIPPVRPLAVFQGGGDENQTEKSIEGRRNDEGDGRGDLLDVRVDESEHRLNQAEKKGGEARHSESERPGPSSGSQEKGQGDRSAENEEGRRAMEHDFGRGQRAAGRDASNEGQDGQSENNGEEDIARHPFEEKGPAAGRPRTRAGLPVSGKT